MKNVVILFTILVLTAISFGSCNKESDPETEIPLPAILSVTVAEKSVSDFEITVKLSDKGAVNKVGILYGTDPAVPDNSRQAPATETGRQEYVVRLTGLEESATYYAKAFVSDGKATNYSEIYRLNTLSATYTNNTVAADKFAGGTGTQDDPYLISGAKHLKLLQQEVNESSVSSNAFYRLTADIEVTADEWTPIGNAMESERSPSGGLVPLKDSPSFKGGFDGGGHVISGTLKSGKSPYFGFFGYVSCGAGVSNLTIAATVRNEGDFEAWDLDVCTGGIAAFSEAPISNCRVTGAIDGGNSTTASSTGGIAGKSGALVTECEVSANLSGGGTGTSYAGGIAGCIFGPGSITNCTYSGTLTGKGYSSSTGGIAGDSNSYDISGMSIKNCTVQATITGGGLERDGRSYTGGIIGTAGFDILDCNVSGSITGGAGYTSTGGIAGATSYSDSGGSAVPARIINCSNSATVTGGPTYLVLGPDGAITTSLAGGIAGTNTGLITNCRSSGKVTGKGSYTGGIAGTSQFVDFGKYGVTTISHCSVEAPVEGETFSDSSAAYSNTGGIVGANTGGNISDCTVAASATITGYCKGSAGGIAGEHSYTIDSDDYARPQINNCTNHAKVSGKGRVGGIAGLNHGIILTNLNTGDISGLTELSYVGGLAGENGTWGNGTKALIYSCSTNRGLVNGQPASDSNQIGHGTAVEPCPDGH
ncbi:MAG: hypothetical protein LBS88_03835 [Tannerellaceae bacterium]|jgi:hypothetical protein|nr:hypothetical protein [Tannerellaceae bacterium]